jgi:hypothetical protein
MEGESKDDFRLGFLVSPCAYIVPEYSTQNHELPYPHIYRQLSQVVAQGSQRAICNGKIVLWIPHVYSRSRILIFSILDPGSNKNINFTKFKTILFLNKYRKNLIQLTTNLSLLTQKLVNELSKVRVEDKQSGIRNRDPEKPIPDPDPEVKKAAPNPGSRSLTMLKI